MQVQYLFTRRGGTIYKNGKDEKCEKIVMLSI